MNGCPVLAERIRRLECRLVERLAPANHTMFVGEVANAVFNGEETPLCTLDYEGSRLGRS